jgi:RNA polymerase sigma-70 factor, ECF subfamily
MPQSASPPSLKLVHDRDRDSRNDFKDEDATGRWPLGSQPDEFPHIPLTVDELYKRFAPYVATIASRILGREGEVQDVVQDVFAAAMKGLRYQEEPHQVRGWLAKVAVRTSMRKLRARRIWGFFDLDEAPQYDRLADASAGPHEKQLVGEVYRALDRLPAKDRIAWVLRYVEGQSLEDTAVLCDCSLATVKRRIAKAHAFVRLQLEGPAERHLNRGGPYVD